VRVELAIVSCLQSLVCLHKLIWFGLTCLDDVVFDGILEIGQKPHSVLELDSERLVIDWRPGATDKVGWALLLALTMLSLHLVLVHDLDFPDLLLGEIKVVVLLDYLELVRHLVGAHLSCLEQVHIVRLRIHVEIPHAVHLSSQT
jgi:hypothetical protein